MLADDVVETKDLSIKGQRQGQSKVKFFSEIIASGGSIHIDAWRSKYHLIYGIISPLNMHTTRQWRPKAPNHGDAKYVTEIPGGQT